MQTSMKKTQIGWAVIIIVAVIELMIFIQPLDKTTQLIVSLGMVVMLVLFGSLTIIVNDTHLTFFLGIGLIRGKYDLKDIVYCRSVNYFSLGWGIRFKPGITIFNVSGNKAIEIKRRSSYQLIYLGTEFPEEIAAIVNEKIRERLANS